MTTTLSAILFEAANNRDTADPSIMYAIYKRDIQRLGLPPEQYAEAVKKLIKIILEE